MRSRITLVVFLSITVIFDIIEATRTHSRKFNGIFVPVVTPMRLDTRAINLDVIPAMARDYDEKGCSGVILTGRDGEGYLLGESEFKDIFKAWVDATRDCNLQVSMLVGPAFERSFNLARYGESIGVDAILTVLPPVYKPTTIAKAVADIKLLADVVPNTPVILYVDPVTAPTCLDLAELYGRAYEEIPNFAGFDCPLELALRIRAAGYYTGHRNLFISNDNAIDAAFLLGFNASSARISTVVPEIARAIETASSVEEARHHQSRSDAINAAITLPNVGDISCVKAAYSIVRGIEAGQTRLPLDQVSCQGRRQLTKNLRDQGLQLAHPLESCHSK